MLHRLLLLTDGPSVVVYSRPTKDDIISQYINTDKRLGYLHFAALHMRTHFRSVVFRFNSIPWLQRVCPVFIYIYQTATPPLPFSRDLKRNLRKRTRVNHGSIRDWAIVRACRRMKKKKKRDSREPGTIQSSRLVCVFLLFLFGQENKRSHKKKSSSSPHSEMTVIPH